ncbi:MAG: hypothetical protein H6993_02855 [Pseudomonadales bacterium]|nr:hypothetical protein [Pseudomonadales bacterium]
MTPASVIHLINQTGLTRSSGVRTCIATFVQRLGSPLNISVHLYRITLDGVLIQESGTQRYLDAQPQHAHDQLTSASIHGRN